MYRTARWRWNHGTFTFVSGHEGWTLDAESEPGAFTRRSINTIEAEGPSSASRSGRNIALLNSTLYERDPSRGELARCANIPSQDNIESFYVPARLV